MKKRDERKHKHIDLIPYVEAAQRGDQEALKFLMNDFGGVCNLEARKGGKVDPELFHELQVQVARAVMAFPLGRIRAE